MNKQTAVVSAILAQDASPRGQKRSLAANRKEDPTPLMTDTRQTFGVHHSLTRPRFRHGDFVVSAEEALEKTGVSPNTMAREVVDVERNDLGWMVGVELCEGRYEHEVGFILLEMIDDWTPNCRNGTFFWTRGVPSN